MEGLIINNAYLQSHPLWSVCPSTLRDIAHRDYPNKNYFMSLNIVALDIDGYEKSIHNGKRGNLECTGDAVVGIASEKRGDTLLRPAVMIVELRMGYKHGDNISLTDLKKKVSHTKTLLSTSLPLHPNYYFVFTDGEEPQATSLLYREAQEMGRMQNYKATSISDFINNMKDPSLIQEYQYSDKDIAQSFDRCFTASVCDVDRFSKQFNHWLCTIEEMKNHNNQFEAKHIAECLKNVLAKLNQMSITEDETIVVEILTEDLNNKGKNG